MNPFLNALLANITLKFAKHHAWCLIRVLMHLY